MASAADAAPSFLYLPGLAAAPDTFSLGDEDARYVSRVVRAKTGERLTASDGAGHVAELAIETLRPDVFVRVVRRTPAPVRAPRVLLCGCPEGDRGDWMIEKCAELGVTRFVPVHGERARWPEGTRVERWSRLAVAALRQSQAAWLMGVESPVSLREAIGSLPEGPRWLADPAGQSAARADLPADQAFAGAIGPAPGFSVEELKYLADNGFLPVSLASSRLRTETAAVALAAIRAVRGLAAGPSA